MTSILKSAGSNKKALKTERRVEPPVLNPVGFFQSVQIRKEDGWGAGGTVVYGNSEKNTLSSRVEAGAAGSLPSLQRLTVLAGGGDSDTYVVRPGQQIIVADLGGGAKDTLDLTPLDRAGARWASVGIANDLLLFDITSKTSVLLRDPFGVVDAANRIEFIKLDYRAPYPVGSTPTTPPPLVNPNRSETIALRDFIVGQGSIDRPGTPNLAPLLAALNPGFGPLLAADPIIGSKIGSYTGYNAILSALQATAANPAGAGAFVGALAGVIPADPWSGPDAVSSLTKAQNTAMLISGLATTDLAGFGANPLDPNAQSLVDSAFATVRANLGLIG